MRHRWTLLVLTAVAIGAGSLPGSAWAHPFPTTTPATAPLVLAPGPAADWASASPAAAGAGVLVLASAALGVVLLPRHRRARPLRPLALALLVVVAGFDGAIHSVHHLGDPAGAGHCLVAASAEHVSAAGISGPPVAACSAPALEPVPVAPPAVVRRGAFVPVVGRAPPA